MPRGASPKREREYEELKERFAKSGRYGKRGPQVAARIVNKQRAQSGETKSAVRAQREGRSGDRDLPIAGYQHLTVQQIKQRIGGLSQRDRNKVRKYEEQHKQRETVLGALSG